MHQILSVIAEHGGASARRLYHILCERGPFITVDKHVFIELLGTMGNPTIGLIEQSNDGLLLLGRVGEKLVEHYSFYAVFQTPEEYRLINNGKELGTLPIVTLLVPGNLLIFSGRRWEIQDIDEHDKVIVVKPSMASKPPLFGGDPGVIHDVVVHRMFDVLEGDDVPVYMDSTARELLAEARRHYLRLGFRASSMISLGESKFALATRVGTVSNTTLALALGGMQVKVEAHDGFLTVHSNGGELELVETLGLIADGQAISLFHEKTNLIFEKYHAFLSRNLLEMDALSSRLNTSALPGIAKNLLAGYTKSCGK